MRRRRPHDLSGVAPKATDNPTMAIKAGDDVSERTTTDDRSVTTRRRRPKVNLTFDREGYSHLRADGLHDDSARVAEVLLRGFIDADAREDAAADIPPLPRPRRRRASGESFVLATAHSSRVHLSLVARRTRKKDDR